MSDQMLLIVGVNGIILAVLLFSVYLLFPLGANNTTGTVMMEEDSAGALGAFGQMLKSMAVRLSPGGAMQSMQRRLDIAGNPLGWNVERLFAAKTGALVVMLGLGATLGYVVTDVFLDIRVLVAAVLFAVLGFFLPDVMVYNIGIKRQQTLQATLPDALDLLSVCTEAGLGFDAAVARVATHGSGPLSSEFTRALQEFRLGRTREQVLRAMGDRSTSTDFHHVIQAVVQADKQGIPLAKVLFQQAEEMRIKREQWAEEKAQKLPIKILFPTLGFIFPSLFIVIIGPGLLRIMEAFA